MSAPRQRRLTVLLSVVAGMMGLLLVVAGVIAVNAPAGAPLPPPWAAGPAGDRLPALLPPAGGHRAPQAPVAQKGLSANSIRIPVLGVTGSIGQAEITDGVLIPPIVSTKVGLWSGSAHLDATKGEVTIAGHVNWTGMAPFTFAKLALLVPGDLVYTTDQSANQQAWRVTRVYARMKSEPVDPSAFIGPKGPLSLVLVTCGGDFDAKDYSYDANVYAYATPVPIPLSRRPHERT